MTPGRLQFDTVQRLPGATRLRENARMTFFEFLAVLFDGGASMNSCTGCHLQ